MGRVITNPRGNILRWTILVGTLLLLFAGLFTQKLKEQARNIQAKAHCELLATAVENYFAEYGFRPAGSHAEVLSALQGNNPRKIVFFEAQESLLNDRGEFVDPWKTAYHLNIRDGVKALAWSSGPDRHDNNGAIGSDDIASWR